MEGGCIFRKTILPVFITLTVFSQLKTYPDYPQEKLNQAKELLWEGYVSESRRQYTKVLMNIRVRKGMHFRTLAANPQ